MSLQLLFWVCLTLTILMIATRVPRDAAPGFLMLLLVTGLIT